MMDNVHNGALILLHAVSESNRDALDGILKDLRAAGYSFASLDELQ
ncbi:peptidoglycan/xylan/chitin deacetylase (PgdA/CDA1 family) [Peptococcaceae bacterium DYL19]|nr:peptidoglycan/xylan/chitin deacetylase (PgdA/CDA1 family) [Phosphitispora fastidiosa]